MKKWQAGCVVEDAGRNMQIVLFVDNNGTFKGMNAKGEFSTYSCGCHTVKANTVLEYYTDGSAWVIGRLNEECDTVVALREELKKSDKIIGYLKEQVIELRAED